MKIYLIAKKLSHSFSPEIHRHLADYSYDPIRETIAEALNELEILIAEQKKVQKSKKNTFRKLAKFTKEEIESYLNSIH